MRLISQAYISPPKLIIIIIIVINTIRAALKLNPVRRKVTMKIAVRDIDRDFRVSGHIVKYCS